jgi:hypothetical protein
MNKRTFGYDWKGITKRLAAVDCAFAQVNASAEEIAISALHARFSSFWRVISDADLPDLRPLSCNP